MNTTKFHWAIPSLFAVSFTLIACGEESGTEAVDTPSVSEVNSTLELGPCEENRFGEQIFVIDENAYYRCVNGRWVNVYNTWITEDFNPYMSSNSNYYTWSSVGNTQPYSSSQVIPSSSSELTSSSSSSIKAAWLYLNKNKTYGELTDTRDGQIYKTIEIDNRVWMAENINYDYNLDSAKSFCYGNSLDSCAKYGRLYTWEAAKEACPKDWHLPTTEEWRSLVTYAGGTKEANTKLKTTMGWGDAAGNGTNNYGFSILPAGWYVEEVNLSQESGNSTTFWSSTELVGATQPRTIYTWTISGHLREMTEDLKPKDFPSSVRCVEGPGEASNISSSSQASSSSSIDISWNYLNPDINYDEFIDSRDGQKYKIVTIGKQVWMAENLNYNYNESITATSFCYNNNSDYCEKYGRLYTWVAAMNACPEEWHLPTYQEWKRLLTHTEAHDTPKLWAKNGWEYIGYVNYTGYDIYGFSVLAAGSRDDVGTFRDVGRYSKFWTSTDSGLVNHAFHVDACVNSLGLAHYKNDALSVRCIKGQVPTADITSPLVRSYITDSRDGEVYPIITIGTQTWMAKNLNYDSGDKYNNGDENNYVDMGRDLGRSYVWAEAMDSKGFFSTDGLGCGYGKTCLGGEYGSTNHVRGLCPEGWHLPRMQEWNTLIQYAGGKEVAWKKLLSVSPRRIDKYERGSDDYLFSAEAGNYERTQFDEMISEVYFWTSTELNENKAIAVRMATQINLDSWDKLKNDFSIRCVKDSD